MYMKRSIEQTFKDYAILSEKFINHLKETKSKDSEAELAVHMIVSRGVQKKVEMFIKYDYEQNYSSFEEDGNKEPSSIETEQPCIAADKLPCVK